MCVCNCSELRHQLLLKVIFEIMSVKVGRVKHELDRKKKIARQLLGHAQHSRSSRISHNSLHSYTFSATTIRTGKKACRKTEYCKTPTAKT